MSDQSNTTPRIRLGGRYDILERLGEGGMGVVHKAWDCNLKTEVVIKIPRPSGPAAAQFTERFAREVQALVRLRHPHVVGVLDVGEHQGAPFAVMQFLSGGTLKDRRARDFNGRPVPANPASLRGWLAEVAGALDFVHSQGFIHRDVKPDNILFDAHGNVYLSDFGIAKVLASIAEAEQSAANLTNPGGLIGTLAYMAPEQMGGQGYDGRVDQYALAVTVYEQLAGKGPFADLTFSQVLTRKVSGELQPLHVANPALSKTVSVAVHRAMSGEPNKRYPNCAAFAKAVLDAVAAGTEPLSAPRPAPPLPSGVSPLPCPGCGNSIPLTPSLFGKRVTCYKCRRDLTVAADGKRLIPPVPATASYPGAAPAPAPPKSAPPRPAAPPAVPQTEPLSLDDTDPLTPPPPRARAAPRAPAPARNRSKIPLLLAGVAVLAAVAVGLAVWRFWPGGGSVTRDDVVTGTIDIDFKTRLENAPADAADVYNVDLIVHTEDDVQVRYQGTIHRRPPLKGAKGEKDAKGAKDVPGWLKFNLTVTTQRAGKTKDVGRISGLVPQSTDGLYAFDELKWTNDLGQTFSFAGKVQGKKGDGRERKATEVPVFVGGERMTYLVADADPMKFRGLTIPEDAVLALPAAELGGELTFDYEKGSYLPNDLTFTSGKTADRVMGIINWDKNPSEYVQGVKPGEPVKNARSQYRFNLVFVPASSAAGTSGRVGKDDEKRLTVTDKRVSALTGSINYVDEGVVRKEDADPEPYVLPYRSKLTFKLNANRLTPRQVHTFLKMWLLMSGPVNDE